MNHDQTAHRDLGPYCLQYILPKNISPFEEQTTKVMTDGLRVIITYNLKSTKITFAGYFFSLMFC